MDDIPGGIIEVIPPTIDISAKHKSNPQQVASTVQPTEAPKMDKDKAALAVLTLCAEVDEELEKLFKAYNDGYKYSAAEAIKEMVKKIATIAYFAELPFKTYNSLKEVMGEISSYDYNYGYTGNNPHYYHPFNEDYE